jgi:hypothetical protein
MHDLSLLSLDILAPCWVIEERYPSFNNAATDDKIHTYTTASHIASLEHDAITTQ